MRVEATFHEWLDEAEQLAIMTAPMMLRHRESGKRFSLCAKDRTAFLITSFKLKENMVVIFDIEEQHIYYLPIPSPEEQKANPQLEGGFIRICTEITQALAQVDLSPTESRISLPRFESLPPSQSL